MSNDIKEILEEFESLFEMSEAPEHIIEDFNKIKDYITNLQEIADDRMNTILEIEKYCNNEKEDLISGGEVCEDVLKIIEEIK